MSAGPLRSVRLRSTITSCPCLVSGFDLVRIKLGFLLVYISKKLTDCPPLYISWAMGVRGDRESISGWEGVWGGWEGLWLKLSIHVGLGKDFPPVFVGGEFNVEKISTRILFNSWWENNFRVWIGEAFCFLMLGAVYTYWPRIVERLFLSFYRGQFRLGVI